MANGIEILVKRGTWAQFIAAQTVTPLKDGELGLITDKGFVVAGYNGGYFKANSVSSGEISERPEAGINPGSLFVEEDNAGVATGKLYIDTGKTWIDLANLEDFAKSLIDDALAPTDPKATEKVWSIKKVNDEIGAKVVAALDNLSLYGDWKESVAAATTENVTLTGVQTIDTVVLSEGKRVLVKNQTTASENGIYIVKTAAWEKAKDATVLTASATTSVEDGSQKNTIWTVQNDLTTWIKISSTNYTAGNGLEEVNFQFKIKTNTTASTGQPFNITSDGVCLLVDPDQFKIDSTGNIGLAIATINGGTF